MIKTILLVAFLLGLGAAGAIAIWKGKEAYSKKGAVPESRKPFKIALSAAAGFFLLLIFIPASFHQVETGTVAVVRQLGKIVDARGPGTYFDFYMVRSYQVYDTKVQQDKISTSAYSKDGQTMELEVFLQYTVQTENIMKIAAEYGDLNALQSRIETVTVEKTKAVMSSAEAMTIVQNRSAFSNDVSTSVRDGITADYYVNVKDVVLTNIDFTREFEKAVEDKVIAEQEKQASITRAEAELEVAKLEAERKITAARGDGEAQRILAQAAAEAASSKIIELSRALGYEVSVEYTYVTTVETRSSADAYTVSTTETVSPVKLEEKTTVTTETVGENIITTTTKIALSATKYEIDLTTGPGADKFKALVEDYLEYLAYLEKWNGELPDVVSGDDAISIIVPPTSNP